MSTNHVDPKLFEHSPEHALVVRISELRAKALGYAKTDEKRRAINAVYLRILADVRYLAEEVLRG